MTEMKRILVLSQGIPHPNRGASTVLYFSYISAFKASDNEVLHVCLNDLPKDAEWEGYLREMGVNQNFHALYAQVPAFYSVSLRKLTIRPALPSKEVIDRIRNFNADETVCFDIIAAAVAQDIGCRKLKVWFGDLQYKTHWYNLIYDLKGGVWDLRTTLFTLLICALFLRLYRKVLRDTQLAIASSVSSVASLLQMGAERSNYLPYPWPDGCRESTRSRKNEIPTFVLFGTLSALGSKSALDFLFVEVYPRLKALWGADGFEILIAGSRELPPWAQTHLEACQEAKFLGFVDDLAGLVSRCHAVLAPISVPVGNRSRIITAMSMRALVIAHVNTALGNPELLSGENCYLADSAETYVRYMQKAVDDHAESGRLGEAARATYLKSFEPGVATKRFCDLVVV